MSRVFYETWKVKFKNISRTNTLKFITSKKFWERLTIQEQFKAFKEFKIGWPPYTANNINFYYRTNPVKIDNWFFQQIQKALFLVHFPNFGGKIFFPENPALSCTTSYGFLAPCQNLVKINDVIPRRCPDRQDGRTYRRIDRPYFIGLKTNLIVNLYITKNI